MNSMKATTHSKCTNETKEEKKQAVKISNTGWKCGREGKQSKKK